MKIIKGKELITLVEEQINEWRLESLKPLVKECEKKNVFPLITISREAGAGGRSVGERVAEILGISCYGRIEIESAFEKLHPKWNREVIAIYDEKAKVFLSSFYNNFIKKSHPPYEEYLKTLTVIIMSIQTKERAVIIGRGAGFMLPRESILSIRLIAPFELRIRRIMELENLNEKEGRKRTRELDMERARFCKMNFGIDDENSENYDMIINTMQLSYENTAAVIVEAYKRKFKI